MAQQVRIYEAGGADVLKVETFDVGEPGPGDVLLKQAAVGVNFLDITQRSGAVPIALPSGLGLEGAAVVEALGKNVSNVNVGDRVVYALGPLGAYASGRTYPAERLVKVPDSLDLKDAAAVFFKGLTAQYLIKTTYPVRENTTVLLYGIAGALGQILAPWATALGARVIGVVKGPGTIQLAREAGAAEVLTWSENLPEEVRELTGGRGVDVVYDGIGQTTFMASLDSLRVRGTLVSIGASSGAPDPVSIDRLNKGSLFLTRPGLGAHISDVSEYRGRAKDVFEALAAGIIKPRIAKTYHLSEVAEAHRAIQGGLAQGAVILVP